MILSRSAHQLSTLVIRRPGLALRRARVVSVPPIVSHLLHNTPHTPPKRLELYSTVRNMTSRTQQPPWTPPPAPSSSAPKLSVYNSLTRSKNEFYPLDSNGKKVTWYCCGPTVYDAGHLGHARNYVTTDILRRIMSDYFGYDVVFVQNVTDVDDKIILRARQGFLLEEYIQKHPEVTDNVKGTVRAAWDAYIAKNMDAAVGVEPQNFHDWVEKSTPHLLKLINAEKAKALSDKTEKEKEEEDQVLLDEKETKRKMHLTTLLVSAGALSQPSTSAETFYEAVKPILMVYLDSLPENKNRKYDHSIFNKLSAYWEAHFNEDMRRLNVLPPTITTRVSEFIPENVKFCEKLIEKGFAYATADGSVYFDIDAYEAAGHHYAKLEPWNKGNRELLADGEGALSSDVAVDPSAASQGGVRTTKKSSADFAVWKASKPGEPGWESPWGMGRPGWHIECSVMCSAVLGGKVDIHSGGIDLAFPHHDNEIAQSEAYWDDPCCNTGGEKHQWINYFLHMGHLSIQGSKMSKSLKNFVSIREALAQGGGWTARSLRIVFLLGGWKEGIEIGKQLITEAKAWEARLNKFFTVVRALISEEHQKESRGEFIPQPFGPREAQLMADLDKARASFHANLCNSFTTSGALADITEIISAANIYLSQTPYCLTPVKEVATWVTRMVQIFGLDNSGNSIGWSTSSSTESSQDKEAILAPYLSALSTFRDSVRNTAMAALKAPPSDPKELPKQLLSLTDSLRNEILPPLGVRLDDRENAPALIKMDDPAAIKAEIEEKAQKAAQKAAEKAKREEEARQKEEERAKKERVHPKDLFRTDEYEEWDAEGFPTKLKGGEELPKSRVKKVRKLWDTQMKAYEARKKKDEEEAAKKASS